MKKKSGLLLRGERLAFCSALSARKGRFISSWPAFSYQAAAAGVVEPTTSVVVGALRAGLRTSVV